MSILALVGVTLFVAGFFLVRDGRVPGIGPQIVNEQSPFGESQGDREIRESGQTPSTQRTEGGAQRTDASSKGLKQLTTTPVAGATVFSKNGETFIRYMEKQAGHIFELKSGESRAQRIINTTIPGVVRTLWSDGGENLVFQYLDSNTIKTTAGTISATGTVQTIKTFSLPDNIHDISIAPTAKNIFYILAVGDTAVGTVANMDGSGRKQIFNFPITELTSRWTDAGTITILTKPSASSRGFFYSIGSGTGTLKKLLGDITGLTAIMSPNKTKILFSGSAPGTFNTFVYDVLKKTSQLFPIRTLPEKCVWSGDNTTLYCGAPETIPVGDYPDAWYQGKISFTDTIWSVNTETGALDVIAIPKDDAREEIDAIDLLLNKEENLLLFTNKKDSLLWSLQLH